MVKVYEGEGEGSIMWREPSGHNANLKSVMERERGELGRKRIRLLCISKKVLVRFIWSLESKLSIRRVLFLVLVLLLCSFLGC